MKKSNAYGRGVAREAAERRELNQLRTDVKVMRTHLTVARSKLQQARDVLCVTYSGKPIPPASVQLFIEWTQRRFNMDDYLVTYALAKVREHWDAARLDGTQASKAE